MPPPTPDLPEDVLYRLQRCEGFLDLNMAVRARAEWNVIPPEYQDHPSAQHTLLHLLSREKNWQSAREVAVRFHARSPEDPASWIQLAYTTRRAQSMEAARQILETARPRFPGVSVIPYNLACYACQSGRLEEARKLLSEAAQMDEKALRLAAEDDDLRALWPELPDT